MENKEEDPFFRLQYIAYCRNYTPPEEGDYRDLINFAKNYLCLVKRVLFNDPIWDTYGDEAILVEYYSVRMDRDPDFKNSIETRIKGKGNTADDLLEWADKKSAQYAEERRQQMEDAKINFSPGDIKDDK